MNKDAASVTLAQRLLQGLRQPLQRLRGFEVFGSSCLTFASKRQAVMGKLDQKKELAEILFIEQGMSAKAVSEQLEVREATIGAWRKKGEWDIRREETLASPFKIRELLTKELMKVANGEKSTIDTNALAQISKVRTAIADRNPPEVVLSVMKEFDNWMAEQDPALAIQFTNWHKAYLLHIISLNGE